jgi:hypothetical protein
VKKSKDNKHFERYRTEGVCFRTPAILFFP